MLNHLNLLRNIINIIYIILKGRHRTEQKWKIIEKTEISLYKFFLLGLNKKQDDGGKYEMKYTM